jgi:hypothetical protein
VGLGIAALVAVGAVVVGLLSSEDETSTSASPAGIDLADLEPALITEDEVGGGFRLDPSSDEGSEDETLTADNVDASAECKEALESFEDAEDDDVLAVEFTGDVEGAAVAQELSLLAEDDPSLPEIARAFDDCATMAWEEEGLTGEYRIDVSDVAGVGDEALGMRLAVEAEYTSSDISFSLEGYAVMSQRDGVASVVSAFGGVDEDTLEGLPVDEHTVRELAQLADGKLADLLAG